MRHSQIFKASKTRIIVKLTRSKRKENKNTDRKNAASKECLLRCVCSEPKKGTVMGVQECCKVKPWRFKKK